LAPGMPSGRDSFRRNRVAPTGHTYYTTRYKSTRHNASGTATSERPQPVQTLCQAAAPPHARA